ncbi:MAG: 50S ribosomal protein L25/general stress protein Ctc [Bacteroidales bacterium]|nr:50S ribosomal protein L25/general stress protein Ctc [Bacteroidales bacterium]MDD5815382.1 50S ribosomal protein L25/general stress protein Ctc [Bacteroidales bacterium]MDY4521901.1 50S ribosomal protein L25/general stress protein Ctc [Bacteroidales bacterium]
MQTFDIKGTKREVGGKKAAKQLRRQGLVPCIVYGGEKEIAFSVPEVDFRGLIYTPNVYIVNLTIDGETMQVILKDIQFHPVADNILHVDFLQVFPEKPVTIGVPLRIVGHSEGVKAGGKLQVEMRKLNVKGLIANLPDILDVDITTLGLGQVIKVGDLHYDNLEILNAKSAVVAGVKSTRAAVSAAAAAAAAAKK